MRVGGRAGGGGGAAVPYVAPEIVVPVETAPLARGNIATYFETTSRVEAERKVDVAAKAAARCESLKAEVGDLVEQGQILAELERDETEATYAQSEVTTRQNKTSYELAREQYEEGLGPKVEMDNARYAYEQSLATLETQKIQLENLTIRAPIAGIVTQRDIQPGMLVSSGFLAFRIVDPTSYILTISPPERELPRLEVGQVAKVTVDALRGREFDAKIRRINPSVDPVSGTVKVVLDFDEEARKSLHDSAFTRVKLVMATLQNVLLVPKEALLEEEGRQYVFVVRDPPAAADGSKPGAADSTDATTEVTGVAERVDVQIGVEDAQRVQIIGGLQESDQIIVSGQHSLRPGSRVHVTTVHDEVWKKAESSADEALERAKAKRAAGGEAKDGEAERGRRD